MPFRYRDDQVCFQLFCLLQDFIDGLPRPHLLFEGTSDVMRRVDSRHAGRLADEERLDLRRWDLQAYRKRACAVVKDCHRFDRIRLCPVDICSL